MLMPAARRAARLKLAGKSGTPFPRMHRAKAVRSCAVARPTIPTIPGGILFSAALPGDTLELAAGDVAADAPGDEVPLQATAPRLTAVISTPPSPRRHGPAPVITLSFLFPNI